MQNKNPGVSQPPSTNIFNDSPYPYATPKLIFEKRCVIGFVQITYSLRLPKTVVRKNHGELATPPPFGGRRLNVKSNFKPAERIPFASKLIKSLYCVFKSTAPFLKCKLKENIMIIRNKEKDSRRIRENHCNTTAGNYHDFNVSVLNPPQAFCTFFSSAE